MSAAKQNVILCEGYDDRSFWTGWLRNRGCEEARDGLDAWGRPVKGQGRYLFRTPSKTPTIVHPFMGRENAKKAVNEYLGHLQAELPTRVILNLDSDAETDSVEENAGRKIRGIARDLAATGDDDGPFAIGESTLYGVIWKCGDPETPGLPRKQTLERLAAAAILAAHPGRGTGVDAWLGAPPEGLKLPKSYAWSYYAKWHAGHGTGDFYESLWRDERVRAELENRLRENGSWDVVEALVND